MGGGGLEIKVTWHRQIVDLLPPSLPTAQIHSSVNMTFPKQYLTVYGWLNKMIYHSLHLCQSTANGTY